MTAAQHHLPAERTRQILEDLEAVRENLLALSDDIWLSIDHNDNDALVEGVQFKQAYNQPFRQRPAQYHPPVAGRVRPSCGAFAALPAGGSGRLMGR